MLFPRREIKDHAAIWGRLWTFCSLQPSACPMNYRVGVELVVAAGVGDTVGSVRVPLSALIPRNGMSAASTDAATTMAAAKSPRPVVADVDVFLYTRTPANTAMPTTSSIGAVMRRDIACLPLQGSRGDSASLCGLHPQTRRCAAGPHLMRPGEHAEGAEIRTRSVSLSAQVRGVTHRRTSGLSWC